MSGNAKAEDLVVRIKPPRHQGRFSFSWLSTQVVVVFVLLAGAAFFGVMYVVLQDAGSFSHSKIEFPPLPQVNAAIAAAQERLKVNPQDITTLVELGTLHFEKGKEFYPDAINELEEARELGALDPRIFYCLGIMYQEVGLYSFALEEYKRYLRHYPDDKETRMLEAKLLYRQKNYPEAVSEYERLKFHYPNDILIEENLGLSLWAAKEVDRAVESFTQLESMGGGSGPSRGVLSRPNLSRQGPLSGSTAAFSAMPAGAGRPRFRRPARSGARGVGSGLPEAGPV